VIRKPKVHFGISLKGKKFRERWNIVQKATEAEFKQYLKLENDIKHAIKARNQHGKADWKARRKAEDLRTQQRYLRNLWRKRYGDSFRSDVLYKMDKTVGWYDIKISSRSGYGWKGSWNAREDGYSGPKKGDLLMYSHTDSIGFHYFIRVGYEDQPWLLAFKPTDTYLCAVVPLEET